MQSFQFREAGISDIASMHEVRMAVKENVLNNPLLVTAEDYEKFITRSGKGWVVFWKKKWWVLQL